MLWAQDQFLKAKPARPAGPSAPVPEAGPRTSQAHRGTSMQPIGGAGVGMRSQLLPPPSPGSPRRKAARTPV